MDFLRYTVAWFTRAGSAAELRRCQAARRVFSPPPPFKFFRQTLFLSHNNSVKSQRSDEAPNASPCGTQAGVRMRGLDNLVASGSTFASGRARLRCLVGTAALSYSRHRPSPIYVPLLSAHKRPQVLSSERPLVHSGHHSSLSSSFFSAFMSQDTRSLPGLYRSAHQSNLVADRIVLSNRMLGSPRGKRTAWSLVST